ncbi:MAG: PVC-type heme-binding CxxCH protein [Planctomycetaceae bacterium]
MSRKNGMHLRVLRGLVWGLLPLLAEAQGGLAEDLFNGRDLTGWQGDVAYWRVESGAIVGEIGRGQTLNHNTWLVWTGGELADFELRLRVKLTGLPAANSGIQFRCQVDSVDHVSGYQADLDMGAVWLGRIYDEHGRALLVERGTRVRLAADGARTEQRYAPAEQFAVLFRENDWNEYRIVAAGPHVAVYVNGTLFSELWDEQRDAADLQGRLAFQLHSGPETRVEFRDIRLDRLPADQSVLGNFPEITTLGKVNENPGISPVDSEGKSLNLGFEAGDLSGWSVEGTAFQGQPVREDGIAQRWRGQVSGKEGQFFIGGYELVKDAGIGTLTSPAVEVTKPWGSFLIAGGRAESTRVEIVLPGAAGVAESVLFRATGREREQMRRVAFDLRSVQGRKIRVRLVDENPGGWGHLNFDDFRLHDEPPAEPEAGSAWRSTENPVLAHLRPNRVSSEATGAAAETLRQMHVPDGFSVDVVAAEPQLHQPIAFTFDTRGRLWVAEGHSYPTRRPEGQGLDRIVILSDRDGDGSFEDRRVFMEGLNLVSGLEVGHGGVWLGAAPYLLFVPDADQDDRADGAPQVLLDGFDYADTHETLNSFQWGPDGWLYGNQGVFNSSLIGVPGAADSARVRLGAGVWRYHPQRRRFEVFAHGGSNQWGLDYDRHGQWFMTHCRSFWGRGLTTHVVQGGHYWNQSNSGYAPFVSAVAVPGRPWLKNYLLASARYDHGEGGAGRPGTDQVYGGHSHVGTLVYQGSNWPSEYRDHLLTHNLHGHQINRMRNDREGGGYRTRHAGTDVLFCGDRAYVAVDLQTGPDGALYLSDWYDVRHCHNPDAEQWDRGNGRIYRMKYDASWRAAAVDLTKLSDVELAGLQQHENEWHVRGARQVLAERARVRSTDAAAVDLLRKLAAGGSTEVLRLRALWTLAQIDGLGDELLRRLLADDSEYVRAWVVQLAVETRSAAVAGQLSSLAAADASLLVLRALAAQVSRLDAAAAWSVAEALAARGDLEQDEMLPGLLFFGIAGLLQADAARGVQLAESTVSQQLRDQIDWYLARTTQAGRERLILGLRGLSSAEQRRRLQLLELSLRDRRGVEGLAGWTELSAGLYAEEDAEVRALSESIGAALADPVLLASMRSVAADGGAAVRRRRQAVEVLASAATAENLSVLLGLLGEPELRGDVIPRLARFRGDEVAEKLLAGLGQYADEQRQLAVEVLCGRADWSARLLDEIEGGRQPRSLLTAWNARQMAAVGDAKLRKRLEAIWGRIGAGSEELQRQIQQQSAAWRGAPLWAYDGGSGKRHFQKLCAQCHLPTADGPAIAPRLEGTGAKGIEYLVENLINPDAVIGRDYQARVLVTTEGRVLTGMLQSETPESVTLRTLNSVETVNRGEIEELRISDQSFMPRELLQGLNERERIELLKYVMGL